MVLARVLAGLAGVTGAKQTQYGVEVLSSRPDTVSGGDVLVQIN